eukprot:1829204-Rhodomonas_salina.2
MRSPPSTRLGVCPERSPSPASPAASTHCTFTHACTALASLQAVCKVRESGGIEGLKRKVEGRRRREKKSSAEIGKVGRKDGRAGLRQTREGRWGDETEERSRNALPDKKSRGGRDRDR